MKKILQKYYKLFSCFDRSSFVHHLSNLKFPLLLIILGIFLRLFNLNSISLWDEGWFIDIAARMLTLEGNPILPLYEEFGQLKLFDKPPFVFWCGALAISIFGFSTLGAKIVMGVMGGLLGVCAYYLLSKNDGNHIVAMVAGLFTTCTWFVVLYSRTAYIDVIIVCLSSLVVLFAIRGADELFTDNPNIKLAYTYLILCGIVNVFSLLAKVWQGLIPGVAVVIYLFIKYSAQKMSKEKIKQFWNLLNFRDLNPVSGVSGVASFSLIALFFLLGMSAASLFLAIFCAGFFIFGFNGFFSGTKIDDQKPGVFTTGIFSLICGLTGAFVSVLGASVLSSIYGRVITNFLEVADLQNLSPLVQGLLFGLAASLIGLCVCIAVCVLIVGLFFRYESYLILIREFAKLIPVFLIGGWVGFWGLFILFQGAFFNRNPVLTILVGAIGALLALILSISFNWILETDQTGLIGRAKPLSSLQKLVKDALSSSPYTLYIGIAAFLIILTFFPILNWIKYLDANFVIPEIYVLRRPGELQKPPAELTYEWLFFKYYIGWRYVNPSPRAGYTMWASVSTAFSDPLFLAVIPFFIVGIYAFYKTRHYAQGALFLSWFGIVMAVFLPAEFQLNYYYLAAFLPYLCIASKGFAYVFSDPGRLFTRNLLEKLFISTPYTLVMIIIFIIVPMTIWGFPQPLHLVLFTIMEGGYLILVWRVNESVPGILTLGFCLYSVFRCFDAYGLSEFDVLYFIIAGLAISVLLYWLKLKSKIRFSGLFVLGVILLSTLTCLSGLVYSNKSNEADFETIAGWILKNGGDYDFSTRVFSHSGARYAMRFYLNHEIVPGWTENGIEISDTFWWRNNQTEMEMWVRAHPDVRFWVVTNQTYKRFPPDSNYAQCYLWLKENLQCYDEEVGIQSFHSVHLYANLTGLEFESISV